MNLIDLQTSNGLSSSKMRVTSLSKLLHILPNTKIRLLFTEPSHLCDLQFKVLRIIHSCALEQ